MENYDFALFELQEMSKGRMLDLLLTGMPASESPRNHRQDTTNSAPFVQEIWCLVMFCAVLSAVAR